MAATILLVRAGLPNPCLLISGEDGPLSAPPPALIVADPWKGDPDVRSGDRPLESTRHMSLRPLPRRLADRGMVELS